eukprot:TRINITY_DN2963_c1_g3_i1.p1 TRINITY_DN2963_c1_g3~~TRINITY_DN2963_c1_g3_i1.p1  ORF type:complete len:225 (+),score=42.78 TRINITY_DN2963_c1_g3_i1:610-1284(+)
MHSSSSSPFMTPPCSPQARGKRNLWFQQENDNVAQSPPSVDRKTRICFSEEEGNCQSPSDKFEGQVVMKARRLAFEQREVGVGGKVSEPSQLRLHSMEGVEEIEEGWRTPQRKRIQAAEVCPPAPKKPVRRRPMGGGVLSLATATRKIDFEMAATVFSFNSRRRVLVEEPESDSGHEGEPPNRRQRCSLHQEGGWSSTSSFCESGGLAGCAAESSSREESGDDS